MEIVKKILDYKAAQQKRYPCKSNRASSIGYFVPEIQGCLRRGVYERTAWKEKELPDGRLALIFGEGNNQEQIVMRDMAEAGIQLIEQQGAFEWEQYQITGHLDGVIVEDGVAVPVEIKSMSPYIFGSVNSFEDFKKKPWTRSYMAQIMIYMLSKDVDRGIFVLKNKSTGELKQIDCALDYELAEYCLRAAEAINKHVNDGTLPDRIKDVEKCRDCPFKLTCLPEINFGVELKIADDPEYEERIKKYLSLKDSAMECEAVYKTIRERAKASAADGKLNILVGGYMMTGKTDARGALRINIEAQQ